MGTILAIIAIMVGLSMINSIGDEPMIWEEKEK